MHGVNIYPIFVSYQLGNTFFHSLIFFIMTTLAIVRYQSYTLLAHPVTAYTNGYTQVYDVNGNPITLHSSYVTDITNYPEQRERAKSMYNYLDTKRLDYGGAK